MRFFDLVTMKHDSLEGLAGRLGYKKIFSVGGDVEIIDSLRLSSSKKIVRSDNNEIVIRALRRNDVVGLLPSNYSISKKILENVKNEEKTLFLPLAQIVCAEGESRLRLLGKARSMLRNALRAKVSISLVSLAQDREGILSSAQMIEVANFLGIEHEKVKPMLSVLGDLL